MRTSVKALTIVALACGTFIALILTCSGTARAAACTTSSFTAIAFGSLDVYSMSSTTMTSTVTGTCASGATPPVNLSFDNGTHPQADGFRAVPCSSGCGSDVLEYYLCSSATCNSTNNIANNGSIVLTCPMTGVTCNGGNTKITGYTITVYATPVAPVAHGVNDISVGTYGSDTVTVTP